MEDGGAVLPLLPARLDEGRITVEPARSWSSTVGHELVRPDPTTHGVAPRADAAGDLSGRPTFAVEAQDRSAAVASPSVHALCWHCLRQIRGAGGVVQGAVRHVPDLGRVPLDDAAQGLGGVDE